MYIFIINSFEYLFSGYITSGTGEMMEQLKIFEDKKKKITPANLTLIKGDNLIVLPQMVKKGEQFDLILIDPPYGQNYISNRKGMEPEPILYDRGITNWFREFVGYAYHLIKPDGHIYVFCSPRAMPEFSYVMDPMLKRKNTLVWDKMRMGMGWGGVYANNYEMILFYTKEKARDLNGKRCGDVLQFKPYPGNERDHPNQKPIELLRFLIEKSTKKGDKILDAFMGSGSTGVASLQLGRSFTGIDLDELYFKRAERRLKEIRADIIKKWHEKCGCANPTANPEKWKKYHQDLTEEEIKEMKIIFKEGSGLVVKKVESE